MRPELTYLAESAPTPLIEMTPGPPDRLLSRLLDQWIVLPEEWEETPPEVRAELVTSPAPSPLLDLLHSARLLTKFQVEAIRQGMENDLIIGHYRLLELIGAGGMGSVYRAEHLHLRRQVAIKIMSRTVDTNQRLVHRFYSEARAVARMQHPHIVTCLDAGLHARAGALSRDYYVMELIPGNDLLETVRLNGPISPKRVCELFRQVSEALAEAHRFGLVHRDIKPSNIQITPDWQAKLLDFGLALQPQQRMTVPGTLLGTVGYMAPEQIQSPQLVDARADLFSLGATMFWALTGREPYPETGHMLNDLNLRLKASAVDVRRVKAEIPTELAELIANLTNPDPEKRIASASIIAVTLAGFSRWHSATDCSSDMADSSERKPKVLVVDDDNLIRRMVRDSLTDCEISEASDGQIAWDMMEKDTYDLMVLDINIPRISGTELVARLRKTPPEGPPPRVLVMSGNLPVEALGGLLTEGADDYLEKPFTFAGLRSRARGLLCRPNANASSILSGVVPAPVHRDTVRITANMMNRVKPESVEEIVPLIAVPASAIDPLSFGASRLLEETGMLIPGYHRRLGRYVRALCAAVTERGEHARLRDPAFLELLVNTAPIHDAGLLVIPNHLLMKPGKLDAEEYAIVQSHTVIGSEVLGEIAERMPQNVPEMVIANEIIRHHHERWDGGGYPDGLVGSQIPLSARVVAIASIYDALRTRRPYRPAFSHPRAIRLLSSECAGQFDPVILTAFSTAAPWFETIFQDTDR
ncbi:hypothetical protein BH11PLA2_BH11PLA2_28690 [soil metagenome]